MIEFEATAVKNGVQNLLDPVDDSDDDRERWAVVVQPPEEYEDDPREAAERLFADLHGHGRLSYEIHSNGSDVELQVGAVDRSTTEAVARHVRSEIGARADVRPMSLPIDTDDSLAAAEFSITKDVIFPIETAATSEREVGQLHHILDTFAEDDVRGVYQVVAEPVKDDWTARRSRSLPESIPQERDTEQELKRAGVAMVPVFALSLWLSPWPFPTALIVALGLVMAATIGEGVSVPQYRSAREIAREHRDRTKDRYGAKSPLTKNAEKTADVMLDQATAPGWKATVRLVVAGDRQMESTNHRDRLVAQVEGAFSSSTTGQELTATLSTGSDARQQLDHVRTRHLGQPSPLEIVRRLLGKGTRRELHVGPGEFAALANFPDMDGGGGNAREFSMPTETTKALPPEAPSVSPVVADGDVSPSPDYHLDADRVETGQHDEFGEVEIRAIEECPGENNVFAGEWLREIAESGTRDSNMVLGTVEDGDDVEEVAITPDQLNQHIFICGASGSGKSTLALYLVQQHAYAGRGFCIIDPHDEFIDDIRRRLPEHRKDDVILIDPERDSDRTVTLNFLDVELDPDHPDYENAVNAAVSDLAGVLKQGTSNIGDRMEDTVRTIARGMILSPTDYTLLHMQELMTDAGRREEFAIQMRAEGREYIARAADNIAELGNDDLAPVARLFNRWVMSPVSRQIIEQTESSFSFSEAVANDRIILVKNDLSDNDLARQVGTTVYRGVMRACEERDEEGRENTYPLIIDEVDDIYCPEMKLGDDLGNARKYGVSLTLLTQLPKRLSEIQDELETNCKTFVSYACPSPKQARVIASMFDCEQRAIGKLGDYVSQIQIDIGGERSGPYKTNSPPPIPAVRTEEEAVEEIDVPSLERSGVERANVAVDIEPDGGQPADEEPDPMDEFLTVVATAADAGILVEDEHFAIVHEGKVNETLRINPSRVIEALDHDDLRTPQEYTALSKERVDERGSYVTGHRKRTPGISRGLGVSMNALSNALSDVDRGMFVSR